MQMRKDRNDQTLDFNCDFYYKDYTLTCLGEFTDKPISSTVTVTVPLITNLVRIARGAELLMQIEQKQTKVNTKPETWKNEEMKEVKRRKKD